MRRLLLQTSMAALAAATTVFMAFAGAALAVVGPAAFGSIPPLTLGGDPERTGEDSRERAALAREARRKRDAARRRARAKVASREPASREPAAVAIPAQLEAIAQCESGGDPRAIGGGGLYRGKYQFSYETWGAVGGSGDPAQASEVEQDRRAALLYARSGPGQWPVCGG